MAFSFLDSAVRRMTKLLLPQCVIRLFVNSNYLGLLKMSVNRERGWLCWLTMFNAVWVVEPRTEGGAGEGSPLIKHAASNQQQCR